MPKINVQKFSEKQTNSGKTKYQCLGTIDGELDSFDMFTKPTLNTEFDGDVKDDPKWGKTVFISGAGGSRGGGASRFNDPETRGEIIRQNALTNAVAFCAAKAGFMSPDEGLKYLTGKQIVTVATYFAKYSKGEVTVVMSPDDISEAFGYEVKKPEPTVFEQAQDVFSDEPPHDDGIPF